MGSGTRFAFALLLLWVAFVCFYVAFHPGGVQVNGHPAQNPADILKYMAQRLSNPQGGPGGG